MTFEQALERCRVQMEEHLAANRRFCAEDLARQGFDPIYAQDIVSEMEEGHARWVRDEYLPQLAAEIVRAMNDHTGWRS